MARPVILVILDGWGIAPDSPGNAVTNASLPNFNSYWSSFPHTQLVASGEAVGLPMEEKGNSETGHLNLGAGRIVYQDLPRINMAIADGSFYKIPAFLKAIRHTQEKNSNLHLLGLIGQGGVHSNIQHLFALLRLAKEKGVKKVFLHLFSDGRDSPPTSTVSFVNQVKQAISQIGVGEIATLMGRYYGMDRDYHWERTEIAYRALVYGEGIKSNNLEEAIRNSYNEGVTDEFIKPIICLGKDNKPLPRIGKSDAVIFFNFRVDRPRQLTKAFVVEDFKSLIGQKAVFDPYTERYFKRTYVPRQIESVFDRGPKIPDLFFVTMTEYEKGLPVEVAFPPITVPLPLGRVLAERNLRQLRLTETEKERFVTYYFNGQRERPFLGEDRIIIPSPDVPTYDLKPEMSSFEITDVLLKKVKEKTYDFILVNFACPDMVGHTGVLEAGIKACEAVDICLKKIVTTIRNLGGTLVITADHGNIEEMINLRTGQVDTEHSNNPVPFIVVSNKFLGKPVKLPSGILADVAPTILELLEINKPTQFSGRSLLSSIR